MAAHGEYAANSLSQQASFRLLAPHVQSSLSAAGIGKGKRAVIVDYGAAEGLASAQMLDALPKDWLLSIDMFIQDLPSNDWKASSQVLSPHGTLEHLSDGCGVHCLPAPALPSSGLRIFSAPGTFHAQVLPDGSVDLVVSGTAFHWLSDTSELPRPNSVVYRSARADARALPAWQAHSHSDWVAILKARAAELKPGGTFLASVPTVLPDGTATYDVVFEVLDEMFAEREASGILAPDFRSLFTFPAAVRSAQEIMAGFTAVPALELVGIEQHQLANPYLNKEVHLASAAGRADFGRRYSASILAWARRMLEAAIPAANEQERFMSDLSSNLARRADELEQDFRVAVVVAKRR